MVSTWPTRSTASWKYSCLIQPGTLYHLSQASPGIFNPLESLAMYVGAICHDLDHRQAVQQKMTIAPTIKSSKKHKPFVRHQYRGFHFQSDQLSVTALSLSEVSTTSSWSTFLPHCLGCTQLQWWKITTLRWRSPSYNRCSIVWN